MIDSSWVIVCRSTGKPMLETWNFELCQFVNLAKYQVVPILEWLREINRECRPC